MLTKKDFGNKFNYKALAHALLIRVHQADGITYDARVVGYWPTGDTRADVIDVHTSSKDIETIDQGYTTVFVPSPEIDSIEILDTSDELPDWGNHPEVGIYWPRIDDLYKDHPSKT